MILTKGTQLSDNKGNTYTLVDEIGKGGFGSVYKAQRVDSEELYAVKILDSSFATPEQFQSFKNEIEMAGKIHSEYVVKYYYTHDGEEMPQMPPYIIMELSEDGDLESIMQAIDHNDIAEIVNICKQLACGMKSINEIVVHRDIKPSNILRFGKTLKITDFGISKAVDESTRTLTFKGQGTSLYYPPEAWNGISFSVQGDIYSMGIVFYQLFTGNYPYTNIYSVEDYRDAHLYQTPMAIKQFNPTVSPKIISMINRMLEKSPKRRYDNWNEIIECLNENAQNGVVNPTIKKAVEKKIQADNERETHQNAIRQIEDSVLDLNKRVWSQFESQVVNPLSELLHEFNQQYSGEEKLSLSKNGYTSNGNSNDITVYMGKLWLMRIHVETIPHDSLDVNSGMVMRDSDWLLHRRGKSPKYLGNTIIAWGTIQYNDGRGHNLLLIEDENCGYGTWYLMKNRDSGFGQSEYGKGPFAFNLDRLNREIGCIGAVHIYTSEISIFDPSICIEELPY